MANISPFGLSKKALLHFSNGFVLFSEEEIHRGIWKDSVAFFFVNFKF